MAEIVKNEDGSYNVKIDQMELNTLSLLLGYSSDDLVKERAEDWEITNYCYGEPLDYLYNAFYVHRDK